MGAHWHARVELLQNCPAGHCVPVPQAGAVLHRLGMFTPHGTVAGLVVGHMELHSQRPKRQSDPESQRVPKPHTGEPGHTLATSAPQSTVLASGHRGTHTHTPPVHVCPEGHTVPVPGQVTPAQRLGGDCPHATVETAGHIGLHTHTPPVQL